MKNSNLYIERIYGEHPLASWAFDDEIGSASAALPADIAGQLSAPSGLRGSVVDSYGLDDNDNGRFVVSASPYAAYARSAGIPMVFGSKNSVFISPAPNGNPSIVLPGKGFLNSKGKYNNFTLETWVRLKNSSPNPVRIIGPTSSTDGIYLEEGFISIYVGPYTKSYFLGKHDRPMLLHFEYSPERVSLLVNGETAISIAIDLDRISFPDNKTVSGLSRDFIGIYGNESVTPFEIDSLSIFPYLIPPEIAKRHFVFGQGVSELDFSTPRMNKSTIQFDYPFAGYAYNMVYPDTTRWRSGFGINLDTTSSVLKANSYKLPRLLARFDNGDETAVTDSQWFDMNRDINLSAPDLFPYLLMSNPDVSMQASLLFDNLNMISDKVRSVFGFFRAPANDTYGNVLMFKNTATNERIEIYLDLNDLSYSYYDSTGTATGLYAETVADSEYFVAGIDIPAFSASFQPVIGNFFVDHNRVSVSVGNSDGYNGFAGRTFGVHFSNKFFHERGLADRFVDGIIQQDPGIDSLSSYIGSYSLLPISKNGSIGLDIGAAGYWEDIVPLSAFGKTFNDQYNLDTIQFNVDVPYDAGYGDNYTPEYLYSQLYEVEGLYGQDYAYFNALYPTYADVYSGRDALEGLQYAAGFRAFVTLQPFGAVGSSLYSSYTEAASATYFDNTVTMTSASTVKYPVYDNTVIVIPQNVDFDFNDYYLGIHLEMIVRGTLEKNMTIKRLELASWADSGIGENVLGNKYSYPVKVVGV